MSQMLIPKNWKLSELSQICKKITDGDHQTPSRLPTGKMLLSAKNVLDGKIDFTNVQYVSENDFEMSRKRCKPQEGDILFSCVGSIGRIAVVGKNSNFMLVRTVALLKPNDEIMSKYLEYFLRSEFAQNKIFSMVKGSAVQHIYLHQIKKIPIIYPNIFVQKKIVKKLDYVLGQLEEKKKEILELQNLERIKVLRNRLQKQILVDAFSGKLTEQKSSDEKVSIILERIGLEKGFKSIKHEKILYSEHPHKIPPQWKWIRINEVCDGIVPGRYKPSDFTGDIPWITLPDIDGLYVSTSKKKLAVTKEEAKRVNMKIFPNNTVLMCCVGGVGRICITQSKIVPNQQFHGYVCNDRVIPEYIAFALLSENNQIKNSATHTTVSYLNKTKCNSLLIPLAPIEEQKRLVSLINQKILKNRKD